MTVNGEMALTYHSMNNGNDADKNLFDRSIKNLILQARREDVELKREK